MESFISYEYLRQKFGDVKLTTIENSVILCKIQPTSHADIFLMQNDNRAIKKVDQAVQVGQSLTEEKRRRREQEQ